MMGPEQSRAARGLLGWTQQDVADRANVGRITVQNFEAGQTHPQRATRRVLRDAFEHAGIVFIEDADSVGVKLLKTGPA